MQGFVDLFTSTFKAISPGNKSVTKEFSHFLANPLTCGHYRLHERQVSRREAKVVRANGMNGIINTTSRDRCAIYSLTDFLCDCSADSALLRPQWKPEAPAGRPREGSVFDHWLIDRSTCNEMKEDECHRLINNIVAVKSSQLNVLPTDQLPADQICLRNSSKLSAVGSYRYISYSGGYRVANQAVTDPPYSPFTQSEAGRPFKWAPFRQNNETRCRR